jgi:hypothetical protein
VAAVAFAMRGFLFTNSLTNQQPDILTQWLPHYCFLGGSLSSGHIPLWNPYQMAGMPYAADPQSGWLNAAAMVLFSTLGCGTALRLFIALNPLLAGLGLYWFLRKEGLHRAAATAGGLSYSMIIAASAVAISLPFAGTLAWTPFVLVGASGCLGTLRWPARIGWMAVGAFAWGQVASSHMSHGLAMATVTVVVYVVARSIRNVRAGETTFSRAAAVAALFLLVLPLANMAIFIPRMALLPRTSLRAGYSSVGGAVARLAGVAQQPLAAGGVWAGWPFALGSTPGTYAGAVLLLAVPAAARTWGKRYLAAAFVAVGLASYVLTVNALVSAAWFRSLVLHLPYGDVYLHNPGRLRYLMILVVPILGALGIQGLIERGAPLRRIAPWLFAGLAVFLLAPLVLGAFARRYLLFMSALPFAFAALAGLGNPNRRRWAPLAVVGVLTVELVASAITSQTYSGGTVVLGLENVKTNLVPGPLMWPNVELRRYLKPGPIARAMEGKPERFLTWVPPAAFFIKGYLFTRGPDSWGALENGRGMLFGLRDSMGYSPVQLTRYWSFIRATNDGTPLFYNASVIQHPSLADTRLLGIRWLILPSDVPPTIPARKVLRPKTLFLGGRYTLYEVQGYEPLVSVVPNFRVVADGAEALRMALRNDFDPALQAVVQADPGIQPSHAPRGRDRIRQVSSQDIRISVDATAPSLVVVRNSFDNLWTATVDGTPTHVLAADYFLQAVPVAKGHHEVRMVYRDPKIGQGLLASGLVWLGLALAAGVALAAERRRRRLLAARRGNGRIQRYSASVTAPPGPPGASGADKGISTGT